MKCPKCQADMITLELEEVEIDYCEECGGIWLDAGELEMLLGENSLQVTGAFIKEKKPAEQKIRCPACRKKMDKVVCGNTHLDMCHRGHGIWFDKGELAEIIALDDLESKVLDLLNNMFRNTIKEGGN